MTKQVKGFTLIELLVVIGIVAILSAVVILTLNPAELLKQSRDSNRISDMATLKSALSLFLADVSTSSPAIGVPATCYVTNGQTAANVASTSASGSGCGGLFTTTTVAPYLVTSTATNLRAVNGAGWIPVNFNAISSGAPVGNLPIDPSNTTLLYYAYTANALLQFEIDVAAMESTKFKYQGSGDVVNTDGGDKQYSYEVGTAPGLAL